MPLLEKELGGTIIKGATEGNDEIKGCYSKDEGCVNSKDAREGQINNTMTMVNSAANMENKYKTTKSAQQEGQTQSTIVILSNKRPPSQQDYRRAQFKGCRVCTGIELQKGVLELGNSIAETVFVKRNNSKNKERKGTGLHLIVSTYNSLWCGVDTDSCPWKVGYFCRVVIYCLFTCLVIV